MPVKSAIVVTYPSTAYFRQGEAVSSGLFINGKWTPTTAIVDPIKKQVIVQL